MGRLFILLLAIFSLSACSNPSKKGTEEVIVLSTVRNWIDAEALTYITKECLEQRGYSVKIEESNLNGIFDSLAQGKSDVYMDVWTPNTNAYHLKEYKDQIEPLGTVFIGAQAGLVVPSYLPIDTIDELKTYRDSFANKLFAIEKEAGISRSTYTAMDTYEVDYEIEHFDSYELYEMFADKAAAGEWVVATAWSPHWIFNEVDCKFLKDDRNVFGIVENIQPYGRIGFSKDHPEAAQFIGNLKISTDQFNEILQMFREAPNYEKSAERWVRMNKELVDLWWDENALMSYEAALTR